MGRNREIWKPVEGWSHYAVSNNGRVRSLEHFDKDGKLREGRILTPVIQSHGYASVTFTEEGKKKRNVSVHRLVAEAFIPNPENKPQVNHRNGVRADNRAVNLEWTTTSENIKHSYDELGKKPNRYYGPNPNRKMTAEQIVAIRSDNRRQVDIAAEYGIDQTTVSDIKRRKIYRDIA